MKSMYDKRLMDQLSRLQSTFDFPVLIIESDGSSSIRDSASEAQFQGILASLTKNNLSTTGVNLKIFYTASGGDIYIYIS